jgi:hypothetical protein
MASTEKRFSPGYLWIHLCLETIVPFYIEIALDLRGRRVGVMDSRVQPTFIPFHPATYEAKRQTNTAV